MPTAVGNIYIYVKDTKGKPLTDAWVTFDSPYGVTRQTDYPDGKAIFYDIYAGTYLVVVQASGYLTYQGNVTVAVGQQTFTVQLQQSQPGMSTVTITVTGQGTTDPAPGQHSYDLGSTLYVTALSSAGWHYTKMKRNGVDWTTSNPGEFLNLATTEEIEVVFEQDTVPPPNGGGQPAPSGFPVLALVAIGVPLGLITLTYLLKKQK